MAKYCFSINNMMQPLKRDFPINAANQPVLTRENMEHLTLTVVYNSMICHKAYKYASISLNSKRIL